MGNDVLYSVYVLQYQIYQYVKIEDLNLKCDLNHHLNRYKRLIIYLRFDLLLNFKSDLDFNRLLK